MFKISEKVINLITNVELAAEGQILEEVKSQRGISQRLSLAIAICYSNDDTVLYTYKMQSTTNLQNH